MTGSSNAMENEKNIGCILLEKDSVLMLRKEGTQGRPYTEAMAGQNSQVTAGNDSAKWKKKRLTNNKAEICEEKVFGYKGIQIVVPWCNDLSVCINNPSAVSSNLPWFTT